MTQWFFGPALIDRGFLLTGGQCELLGQAEAGNVVMDTTRKFVTGVACKAVGGKWKDGHDISGHVFLLVLGSMFLFEEVLHVVLRAAGAKEERTIFMTDGAVKSAEVEAQPDETAEAYEKWTLGVKIVLGVGALSLYMLLMTAAYFHTWFEKVSRKTIHSQVPTMELTSILVDRIVGSAQRYFRCIFLTSSDAISQTHHWHARLIGYL